MFVVVRMWVSVGAVNSEEEPQITVPTYKNKATDAVFANVRNLAKVNR